MKVLRQFFCVFLFIILPSLNEAASPHLMLYFDINETLIASDKAGKKSVEDVLNGLLAKKYSARWECSLKEAMTFDDYIHDILIPGDKDDRELRQKRRDHLHHFVDYLREQEHSLYPVVKSKYDEAKNILKQSNSMVFPSFFLLINYLDQKQISYSIILRTFGDEVLDVKNEIETNQKMKFDAVGKFREGKLHLDDDIILETPSEIYGRLQNIGHAAIHDDWKYWDDHEMASTHSKPFYIDPVDTETLEIFFDDNIRDDGLFKNIIAPIDVKTGKLIPVKQLIESRQAVRVNTLEAILNDRYFIELIEEALVNNN